MTVKKVSTASPGTEAPLISFLRQLAESEDRAALAALRRSLAPHAEALAYPFVVPYLPRTGGRWSERVHFLVAGLFALHPAFGSVSLAAALRRASDRKTSSSIEKRFVALLDSHRDDLGPHLRSAVSLVRSEEIAIDWNDLLRTLRWWPSEGHRRQWARDFWAATDSSEGDTA